MTAFNYLWEVPTRLAELSGWKRPAPTSNWLSDSDFKNLFVTLRRGNPPGPYPSVEAAKTAGAVTINLGLFANAVLSFMLVAFATFMLVRMVNRLRRSQSPPPPPSTRKCPYCVMDIPLAATRCPKCTSDVTPTAAA